MFEAQPTRDNAEHLYAIHFSAPDRRGRRLILTLRTAVQCGSSWNALSYDVYRTSASAGIVTPVLQGTHSIWFGANNPFQFRLESNDLLMEIRDRSIDPGIHNRVHILHYRMTDSSARRIDPVALQPLDFADEWLTRPWSEMASRSAVAARDQLRLWHDRVEGRYISGDYVSTQKCERNIGQWQVGIDLRDVKLDSGTSYFLIQQMGQFGFTMLRVSSLPDPKCTLEIPMDDAGPTLFPQPDVPR